MTRRLFLLAVLALLTAPAFAQTTGYDLGQVMVKYHDAATNFGSALTTAAISLCYKLFALDLAWTLIGRLIKGADPVEMATVLIMRVMWLGFVVWIMNNPNVPLAVVNSFIQLGKTGANTSAIGPGDVLGQGIDLVQLLMTKFSDNASIAGIPVPAGVAAVANPFAAFLIGGSLIVILVCFSMLAAQFAVAWIQLWFYMAVYPIALAFGVMKWTRDIAMKVITTPLVYGVRFLAVYFVIAVGTQVAGDFGTDIANLSLTNLTPIWTVLGGSILMLILAMKVPTLASDLLSGAASMSAADGVGAVMAGGGAIAAMGAGLYAGGGAAYKGLSSMLSGGASLAGAAAMGAISGAGQVAGAAAGGIPGVGGLSTATAMPGASGGGAAGSGVAAASAAPSASSSGSAAMAAPAALSASSSGSAAMAAPAAPSTSSASSGTVPAPAAPSASPVSSGTVPAPAAPSTSSTSSGTVPAPAAPSTSSTSSGTVPAPAAPSASPASSGTVPAPAAPSTSSTSSGTVPAPAAPSASSSELGAAAAPAAPADNTASLSDAAGSPEAPKANEANGSDKPEPKGPTAADKSMQAAQRVADEMGKTGAGGSGIQVHHGDD